ncbi:arabinan endo-1,5-alpha-L-arabinosidase [Ferruginibacter paludis]|uniref:arabinan endo-1,5-alpha-L-arabinosidase n=1 Tax=Ferruginibacter paludis TaxID=1310417 RepID=UPI0025B47686|nr:arabinan endo-1,5-alpha-L-arabinosidase [Ferruginibacter paludis]MDN3655703.1 arabinan endo-1,5-alpha-L-arabinosidase [Ferruginibacter paludis]
MKNFLFALLMLATFTVAGQTKPAINDTLISVHDPVIIRQDSMYYIFCTGQGITAFSSPDMKHWKQLKPVFDKAPQWAVDAIPSFRGHIWAPDISYHNGQFYLYYAVSAFGKNTSCIGLATNKTLDPSSKNFKWIDHGKVIQSVPGRDMWNAIDPNLVMDENNIPWLAFGSFWNGMKLVKLDSALTAVAQPEEWYTVAARKRDFILPDSVAGDAAIEAPFIYHHGKYFYLFVSFDYCCRGEKSTYKMMVGRSEKVTGPYADQDGVPMNLGGGSTVLEGDKNWHGVGHNAVANFSGTDYLIFHGYDAADNGRSKLRIEKLAWFNDWPMVERRR